MADVELYLLRHAHAGDPAKWSGDDAARPLSDKGRAQAAALGRHLVRLGFAADTITSSPKLRARQTAEIVADLLGAALEIDDGLAAGPRDLAELDDIVRGSAVGRLVLIGHDPAFSELAAELSGAARLELKKGALVRIDVALPLQPGAGKLRWLLPPDAIG
jgi:phosphohistidine phosphatase